MPFRTLKEKFNRWDWIDYEWVRPRNDSRSESRQIQVQSLRVFKKIKSAERAQFLNPIVVGSVNLAAAKGQTLALIRPRESQFFFERKSREKIEKERRAYQFAANQYLLLDKSLNALEPCPFEFRFSYQTDDGKKHRATCEDWETAAMFYRLRSSLGEDGALQSMSVTFNEQYPANGMAFAMGTHSRHPRTWLLVGVLRLDETRQFALGGM